jgi:histidinol-phosphatase (PHP family)
MSLVDLHVHSTHSADGLSSIAEYSRDARALDLVELGFCEHADFDPRDRSYDTLDLQRYDEEMAAARATISGVRLRQGVEITYQAGLESQIRAWLADRTWDYVIASVHLVDYVDGWAMVSESMAVKAYFAAHSLREAYEPYFEELWRAARSGLGDVLGHLDLVKRFGVTKYGPFDPTAFADEIRSVLQAVIGAGMGLEINTSGWRQVPGEPYPSLTILRWYRELGGEILTIGSDAHHVNQLGNGCAEALNLACEAGFRAITTFEARQPHWLAAQELLRSNREDKAF